MHAAPPVSYPVEASRFARLALALAWCAGFAAVAAWSLQAAAPAWQTTFAFLLLAACGLAAWRSGARAPRGTLAWDGEAWWWTPQGGAGETGRAERALDLQSLLLMRWHPTRGRTVWLWARHSSAPLHWDALRRAVHSRAVSEAQAAARPPIAEP